MSRATITYAWAATLVFAVLVLTVEHGWARGIALAALILSAVLLGMALEHLYPSPRKGPRA